MPGIAMDLQKSQALAAELGKDIKTEAALNALSRELLKLTVETAFNAELTEHLGYEKHGSHPHERRNTAEWQYTQTHQNPARRGGHPYTA